MVGDMIMNFLEINRILNKMIDNTRVSKIDLEISLLCDNIDKALK